MWEGHSIKGNGIAKSKNPSLTRRGRVRSCWVERKQGGSGQAIKDASNNKPRIVTFCREALKEFEETSNRSCNLYSFVPYRMSVQSHVMSFSCSRGWLVRGMDNF